MIPQPQASAQGAQQSKERASELSCQAPDTIILTAIYDADVEKISEVLKKSWQQTCLLAIMRAIELIKLSIELGNAPHHAMF